MSEEGLPARARAAAEKIVADGAPLPTDCACGEMGVSYVCTFHVKVNFVVPILVALAEGERKLEREECIKAVCMFCDADDEPAVLHVDGKPKRFHRPRETWGWEECVADAIRARSTSAPAAPEKPHRFGVPWDEQQEFRPRGEDANVPCTVCGKVGREHAAPVPSSPPCPLCGKSYVGFGHTCAPQQETTPRLPAGIRCGNCGAAWVFEQARVEPERGEP